ncbi:MAG: 2-oxoglutarate dehydrogenase complex dihydrolipoyllysine-residue succinyltransferase [Candidatus Eisenbacteria bacterium]|nr:2-oxoglutarate dehydrogenase complex dihydrolipoyllysine-residue succinyltransferase [Candidatus Eisenbacteria bacterium]
MSIEIRVPNLAESITDATLVEWLKPDGGYVRLDEPVATLETDKAAVEIAATESGVLRHARAAGDLVVVGDVLARIESGEAPAAGDGEPAPASGGHPAASAAPAVVAPPAPPATRTASLAPAAAPARAADAAPGPAAPLSPAVRRLVEEHALDPAAITPTGTGGRLLKEDVLRHLKAMAAAVPAAEEPVEELEDTPETEVVLAELRAAREEIRGIVEKQQAAPAPAPVSTPAAAAPAPAPRPVLPPPAPPRFAGGERVVPMNRIRQRIAERLVQAQHTAAILTTFNEVDMSAVIALRARWREDFEQRHGVRLGFMSFFARACALALEEIPELNAEIRGSDIVYHEYLHLGVAVQTDRGLVVPVVRDAHRLGFAELEREIARLAAKAREHRLSLDELAGGTFTLSNGGVYGSLLSTPILNPPQSGILGMHKIEKRPVAVDDQVVVRPMMYLALSYDHRIVDGEQSVTFLVRVKERLEDPERMLLDV